MTRPRPSLTVTLLLVTLAATILALTATMRPPLLALATNADGLLPADMVWEWLNRPGTWRSFQWPRIPSLMPDMLIIAALQAPFGWRVAELGYAALSLATLAGLAGFIARATTNISVRIGALSFLALTAAILLAEAIGTRTPWHLHLLVPAYHSGPFILAVGALILARGGGAARLSAMTILSALGTFSDRLVVGTFLLPLLAGLLASTLWRDIPRRHALAVALLAITGCTLGLLADRLIFPQFLTRQSDVPLALLLMLTRAWHFLLTRSGLFVLLLNAAVLAPLLRTAWRNALFRAARFWWITAAAAMVPGSLLAAGLWEDEGGQRYLSAILWWPVILWAPHAARLAGRKAQALSLLAIALAAGVFALPTGGRHPLLTWQNDIAACLAPTGRTAGLAEYWQARPISIASNWRLQTIQIGPRGNTRVWGSNPSWYTTDRDRPGHTPPFSFIVMQGLDEPAIRAAYGPPDQVLACPGSPVWLYDDPAAVTRGLYAASPALIPPGGSLCVGPTRLSRRGGALPEGPITVSPDRQISRPVTFGPNLDLHPGRWRISLRYRLQTDHPGDDGWLVNGQWGTLHLARNILPPSWPNEAETHTDITLNREIEAVETPTYLAGQATLDIREACFTPIPDPAN